MENPTNGVIQVPSRKSISVPLDKLDSFEGVSLIARLLREWERESSTHTFKGLAKMVGLTPTTVARLASGDTKAPRLHTILMIMKGLGFSAVRFD